jgi:hypothetical protein
VPIAAKSVSQLVVAAWPFMGKSESQLGNDDEVGVEHIEAGQNQ